mmetsp:Transcript_116537/g.163854  ORF Transcript_116537/g.163854 Transcript_116537/m.163854 type:complete len:382 (+) Transcript_116537:72-1217(+)|eukprot:s2223_g7.t1
MRHREDELAVRKHLKVFVGGLPDKADEREVEQHFTKYGHVVHCNVCPPKDGEKNKAPYAFVTFRFAADADCAVVDRQDFPGVQRQLAMGFATPRKKDTDEEKQKQDSMLSEADPCKVFVGGIGDRDSEEEVGDFFSQWGLVTLVYRDRASWGFVHFATKEAALRILEESNVVFHRRRLDIKKASESKKTMSDDERYDLVKRAIARHFHKKSVQHAPPPGYPPPGGYYPPPPGYYGAPPPGYPGYPPPSYPPPGYPPSGAYPPVYGSQPPPGGHYAALPPSGPPPPREAPAPSPADDPYRQPAGDPYSAYGRDRDPYSGYDRDREHDRYRRPEDAPSRDPYAHLSGGYYGPPPGQPEGAPPPAGVYASYAVDPRYEPRYQPY